ncbi:MAG: hydroxymethylglutaryl-CoA reductase, degradative [Saprospiraceae bacterium]|nr:MAG: hydroxymethylglutaryl-CoA reductase, degradative [Bacteroidetes bacterium OLB9]MCO6463777.1 hydroxymethylglutaryl-CoA reductase, degradative [Saprospiraceae bacterium]
MKSKSVKGFSKFSKSEKISWLISNYLHNDPEAESIISEFRLQNHSVQKTLDGFSENTISNFIIPYGLAPNFLIDGEVYCVPMAIEESSVVAAAASAAKYWQDRGGFTTKIIGTVKIGQVHFKWSGDKQLLYRLFPTIRELLIDNTAHITQNMIKRGGGILNAELLDFTDEEPGLYQIRAYFETCDSMGANFINSVLECFADTLETIFLHHKDIPDEHRDIDIIMSILSNYTPQCLVRAEVSCKISELGTFANGMLAHQLAEKFRMAVRIAQIDPYRATTHNKGIYNGIDAVVLATGNDFRAIEAAGHTYAARDGQYRSLSYCEIEDETFRFWLEVPLALGTIGGLTSLHPLAKKTLEILGNPSAEKLMRIIASVGLAQNFAAVKSLVTTGIQQGHMKMHLMNILNQLQASDSEIEATVRFFEDKVISFAGVRDYVDSLRQS